MFTRTLLIAFLCIAGALAANGQTVYVTEWKTEANKVVYVTDMPAEADILVFKTEWKSDHNCSISGISAQ